MQRERWLCDMWRELCISNPPKFTGATTLKFLLDIKNLHVFCLFWGWFFYFRRWYKTIINHQLWWLFFASLPTNHGTVTTDSSIFGRLISAVLMRPRIVSECNRWPLTPGIFRALIKAGTLMRRPTLMWGVCRWVFRRSCWSCSKLKTDVSKRDLFVFAELLV